MIYKFVEDATDTKMEVEMLENASVINLLVAEVTCEGPAISINLYKDDVDDLINALTILRDKMC